MNSSARADAPFEARVVAGFGRHYLVESGDGEILEASRRGKRRDVVVGDRVQCLRAGGAQAVIEQVLDRKSLLYRSDDERVKELAANVDQVAIVFAPQPTFNLRFIWRALAAASTAAIDSVVILNKTDLPGAAQAGERLTQLAALGYRTVAVSAKHANDAARSALMPIFADRVTLLVGQSGMGKSTLLNLLVPDANARTQEFSRHLDLGKQTTTSSRWFRLGTHGAIVDTPGFQAFGLTHLDAGQIVAAFPEFSAFTGQCRFLDCHHLVEPDCAIRAAVDGGSIDAERYAFYRELAQDLVQ